MNRSTIYASVLLLSIGTALSVSCSTSRLGDAINDPLERAMIVDCAGYPAERSRDLLVMSVNSPLPKKVVAVVDTDMYPTVVRTVVISEDACIDITELEVFNEAILSMNLEIDETDACAFASFFFNQFRCEYVDCVTSCKVLRSSIQEHYVELRHTRFPPIPGTTTIVVGVDGTVRIENDP